MNNMNINGVTLNIQVTGTGMPFIWGHGLSGSMATEDAMDWFEWDAFPEAIRLVRYDARGHGASDVSSHPQDYHWRNLGGDMLAIADALNIETFIAGGASMGCATTLYAALEAPERIKAMVLVIPPTAWETRAAQQALYNRLALIGVTLGGKRMSQLINRNTDRMIPWLLENEPEKLLAASQGLAVQTRVALWNMFKGAGLTDLPPRSDFQIIAHIPCLILGWVDDGSHPVSTAKEIHGLLPQSDLFIAQGYQDFKTIPQRIREFVTQFQG